jgi:hypothetical protein
VRYVKAVFEKGGRVEGQGGIKLVEAFHESGILEGIVGGAVGVVWSRRDGIISRCWSVTFPFPLGMSFDVVVM